MKLIGFVGFGSMGGMLVKGFIKSGHVDREQIVVTRKDTSRLDEIRDAWPGISIAQNAAEVARKAKHIFICVKPLEFRNIF